MVRFQEPVADRGAVEVAAPRALKNFRVNAQDLQTHGYTDGCLQCGHIQRTGRGRAGGIHSDLCRDRILKAIGDTVLGRQRLDDYEERVNRAMDEQIERADAAPSPGPSGTGSTARDTLDAVPAAGGLAMASESMDPARRVGNIGSNGMTAARQGDGSLLPGGVDAQH